MLGGWMSQPPHFVQVPQDQLQDVSIHRLRIPLPPLNPPFTNNLEEPTSEGQVCTSAVQDRRVLRYWANIPPPRPKLVQHR